MKRKPPPPTIEVKREACWVIGSAKQKARLANGQRLDNDDAEIARLNRHVTDADRERQERRRALEDRRMLREMGI